MDKSKVIAWAVGTVALSIPLIYNAQADNEALKKDSITDAKRCISFSDPDGPIRGQTNACDRVKVAYLPEELKAPFEKALAVNDVKKAEADKKAAAEKESAKKAFAKAEAERRAKERAEEAAFRAEGWFELKPGIYGRWCTQTCSTADVIGSSSYWLLQVWAKDRAAGDIYARINVIEDGVVVGWTNDTAYLSKGQKGILTFTKYLPGSGSRYTAQLTEFNARG